MRKIFYISRKVLMSIMIIILLILLSPCLDISTALIISLGFGISFSMWSLSFLQEPSFIYSQPNKN
jgi:hypothetical protein